MSADDDAPPILTRGERNGRQKKLRGYLVKRILATIPVMMVVAIFVFSLLRLTLGDPAAIIAGDYANPKDVVQIRQKLGLDEPLYMQFGI
jgi:peptide/nickel transport system permease protein